MQTSFLKEKAMFVFDIFKTLNQKRNRKMECGICLVKYGDRSEGEKPYVIVPCGHSICLKCLSALKSAKCPFCEVEITSKAVNWTVLNAIQSPGYNASDDPASRSLKEFDELRNRVRLIRDDKMNKVKAIKDQVNLKTQKKKESLNKDADKSIHDLETSENRNEAYLNGIQTEIEELSNVSSPAQL